MTPQRPPESTCLFLDVDGTLIEIAPTPDGVTVPKDLPGMLRRAEDFFGGALALVSGRSIADLDQLFAPVRLKMSGVHGAEFRFADGGDVWNKAAPLPATLWTDLLGLLETFPQSLAENKGFSFAVHYRAAPETGPRLHDELQRFLAARPDLKLQILPGHFVYELRRPGLNKGAAISDFMTRAPFAGRRPLFIGDDVTDISGFAAVQAHDGWAYSVGEAFPDVTGTFTDPAAVRRWLGDVSSKAPAA